MERIFERIIRWKKFDLIIGHLITAGIGSFFYHLVATYRHLKISIKKKRIGQIIELFGESLEISDSGCKIVKKHLKHLALLPERLVKIMMEKGVKVRIGNKDMMEFCPDDEAFKKPPRGWKNKKDWSGIAGCYWPKNKTAYAGNGRSGSTSLVLHEYGHAVGDLLEFYFNSEVIDAHKRLYDKLHRYFQQDGPGGLAGRQEFFAESLADYFMLCPNKFIKTYDKEWRLFWDKFVARKYFD